MNHTTQKQVSLIQSHHNYLFTQPLPRQLRETGWQATEHDFETNYSREAKQFLAIAAVVLTGFAMLLMVSCQLQPV